MGETGQIWIGILRDQGCVLYDPKRQDSGDPERVVLWLSAEERFERYYRDMVKRYLEIERDPKARSLALDRYVRFQSREVETNHRNRLANLGVPYSGVSVSAKHSRLTHCYDCKNYLDSSIDIECNTCGWILCRCGACGCGYLG